MYTYRAVSCDVTVPVKWAWLILFGGQLEKSMEKNNGGQLVQSFAADNMRDAAAVVMNNTIARYS